MHLRHGTQWRTTRNDATQRNVQISVNQPT